MDFIELKLGSLLLGAKTGKTPPTNNLDYYNGDIDWYTPGDLKGKKFLTGAEKTITRQAVEENQAFQHPAGTILISTIGDIAKVGILQSPAASNQQITGLVVDKSIINPELLYYWITRSKQLFEDTANKAVISMLNNKLLRNIKVKFPSKAEDQNLIVTKLNRIQDLIDKRQQTIELLEKLMVSVFLEKFDDPVKIRTKKVLGKLLHDILSGWSPLCEDVKRTTTNDKAVIKQGAISKRQYIPSEHKLISENLKIKKYIPVEPGDVLFSRKNTKMLVGSTVFVYDTEPNLLLPDTIFKLVYNPEKLNGIYLTYLFNDINFRKKIQSLANGANQSMIGISQETLLSLEIPYPDIEKQNSFGEFAKKVNILKKNLQHSLDTLESLFHSTLQNAFRETVQINEDDIFDDIVENLSVDELRKGNRKSILVKWLNKDLQRFKDFDKYDHTVKKLFELLETEELTQVLHRKKIKLNEAT